MKPPHVSIITLALLFPAVAQAYYNPTAGKWLTRDPALQLQPPAITAGPNNPESNEYLAMRNDCVEKTDFLGLLTFFKNECQGCNAGDPVFSTDGYIHHPQQTCLNNPEGTYVPGDSGGFDHHCYNYDFLHTALCDTETHVKIKARNDECCEIWQVTCNYHYNGLVKAGTDLSMNLTHFTFMGEMVAPRSELVRHHGGPGAASVSVTGSRTRIVAIPKGAEIFVFNLQPLNVIHGLPDLISEGGTVSCSGRCLVHH